MEIIQFLTEDGILKDDPTNILSDTDLIIEYYKAMTTVRSFDYKAIALQRTGKMGTYPSVLGHETASAAIGMNMQKDDVFVPYYRDQVTQYIRGVSFVETLLYWGGDERGNDFSVAKHDYPWSVPIASQTLHATGVAYALKYNKKNSCVVCTLGDGATSEGDFYEAINAAGAMSLPVVFVIYNNQWAISTPLSKQTKCVELAKKSEAAGINGVRVDGNDVVALHYIMKQAIENAKKNQPNVVEVMTYRLGDHTTADDATKYRTKEELDNAWKKDGINRLEKYLLEKSILSQDDINNIQNEAKEKVDDAVEAYLNIEPQKIDDIFDYHYANTPLSLTLQKEEHKHG